MKTTTKYPIQWKKGLGNIVYIIDSDKRNLLEAWREAYQDEDSPYNLKLDYQIWHEIKNNTMQIEIECYHYINEIDLTLRYKEKEEQTYTFDLGVGGFGDWLYDLFFDTNSMFEREYHCEFLSSSNALATKADNQITTTPNSMYTTYVKNADNQWIKENETVQITNNNNNETKGETNMNGFNFDFGPCNENNVRISVYGIAVKNTAGEWVSYNSATNEIINVDIFNFENGGKYLYKMPVALKDITVGDVIIHNKVPMFVLAINGDGSIRATDVRAGENKDIVLTKNMFGFDFATKIVNLFTMFGQSPTPDQPFGNFLPFMLMNDDKDIDPMLILAMSQGGLGNFAQNPMMLYFLMGDKGNKDNLLPLMMMANGGFKF